ncbi:GNAT family N-acetyltransferase [Bacillus sp. JJ722]|uniref:GNAT family N-acetyltransferase n=1 Tax=Bacillus sp. JJ722 TaxID=3122973 RepID=UPI002FFD6E73
MGVVSNRDVPTKLIKDFFEQNWGSPEMVISSGSYDCTKLEGFTFLNEKNEMIGLITYTMIEDECEIISLDSLEEGKGIGTTLLQSVEDMAMNNNCNLVKLVTTNDNLLALKFYQKRGYSLSQILCNAVDEARKLKPEIPLIGNDGIPIRDEIVLQKVFK